jgi:hypothetical protein
METGDRIRLHKSNAVSSFLEWEVIATEIKRGQAAIKAAALAREAVAGEWVGTVGDGGRAALPARA